jgi:glutathione S-transferase
LPAEPIIIWGYEASPFCKLAREVLTELELPHLYRNSARNSPKRQELIDKWGVYQVPYIEDPNTGLAFFETPKVIDYLEETYAIK